MRSAVGRDGTQERIVLEADGKRAALWRASRHEDWLVELRTIVSADPGRGAGTWALRRALAWAFEECGARRVNLEVTAANARARALYERHGFRWEGTFREGFRGRDGAFEDLCIYGLLAREYDGDTA